MPEKIKDNNQNQNLKAETVQSENGLLEEIEIRERPIHTFLSPDPELNTVVDESLKTLSIEKLDQLMTAYQKFNSPIYIIDNQGREKKDDFFKFKSFIKEIPTYFDSAQKAGLSTDQAQQLIITLLNSSPNEFHNHEITVSLMARAFQNTTKANYPLGTEDCNKLNALIARSAKYGVDHNTLYAYSQAQRIGLSTSQSTRLISNLIEDAFYLSDEIIAPFSRALKTLNVAKVDPNLVVKVFDTLSGDNPLYHRAYFEAFENIVTFICPSREITPQRIMELFMKQIYEGKDIESILTKFGDEDQKQSSKKQQVEIINPQKERDHHFVSKPGELEIAALPYQTQRSLNEGLRDLENIAVASIPKWEEIGKGFWVHDRKSGTWYSFGGQTEIKNMAVRHNMIPFDISQLSTEPLMFHCHPQAFEPTIRPRRGDSSFPERYLDQVTKFLAATPSRADYGRIASLIEQTTDHVFGHSFIVYSLGVTEFVYPTDIERLKQMSVDSRELRDQALLDFNWKALYGRDIDSETLIRQLTILLNKRLPNGFEIKIHPRGYNLNRELIDKKQPSQN